MMITYKNAEILRHILFSFPIPSPSLSLVLCCGKNQTTCQSYQLTNLYFKLLSLCVTFSHLHPFFILLTLCDPDHVLLCDSHELCPWPSTSSLSLSPIPHPCVGQNCGAALHPCSSRSATQWAPISIGPSYSVLLPFRVFISSLTSLISLVIP